MTRLAEAQQAKTSQAHDDRGVIIWYILVLPILKALGSARDQIYGGANSAPLPGQAGANQLRRRLIGNPGGNAAS